MDKDKLDQELARLLAEEVSEIHANEMLVQRTLYTARKSKKINIGRSEDRLSDRLDTQENKKFMFRISNFLYKSRLLAGVFVMAAGIALIVMFAAQRESKKNDAQYEGSLSGTDERTQNSVNSIQNYPAQTPDFFEETDGSFWDEEIDGFGDFDASDSFLEPPAEGIILEENEKVLLAELLAIVQEQKNCEDTCGSNETHGEYSEKKYIIQKTDGWIENIEQEIREITWQDGNEALVCRIYQSGKIELCYTKDKNSFWYILDGWYGAEQLWKKAE